MFLKENGFQSQHSNECYECQKLVVEKYDKMRYQVMLILRWTHKQIYAKIFNIR